MLGRIAYTAAFVLLLLAPHAAAQEEERLTSLLDGAVTFSLPAEWVKVRHASRPANGYAEFKIPQGPGGKAGGEGRVTLTAGVAPKEATVRHLSDAVYQNSYEGLAVLSDAFDGDSWRTVAWTAKVGARYLMLQRFGLAGGKQTELWVAVPLPEGGDPALVERAVAQFNAACESLKIDGRNKFDNRPDAKKINELLKAKR